MRTGYGTVRACSEAMGVLSQDDRQRLAEIEQHLAAEDPRFARRMRTGRRGWPRLVLPIAVVVIVLALGPLLLITWDRPGVAALAVCVALVAMTWMLGRGANQHWRRRR